jgi:hypothetical protein
LTLEVVIETDYLRIVAGSFVGAGAICLILKGEITAGVALLGTMLGFFVGEKNGQAKATATA